MNNYLDRAEFLAAWEKMFQPGALVELRLIGARGKADIRSGYFKDAEKAADALQALGDSLAGINVYWCINEIHDGCYSRYQRDRFLQGVQTTSDNDIVRRRWLPIDFDAVRPSGCSASDEEQQAAVQLCRNVAAVITEGLKLPRLLRQVSGNGGHILVPIDCENTDEVKQRLQLFLSSMDEAYSNEKVHVDLTTFNAARVLKVPGTMACKGLNTPERPWRRAFIFPEDADYIRPAEAVTDL